MLSLIVPVYSNNFTHDEIKGLIEFYQTDLGKKTIEVMPVVLQQSMAAGQMWGRLMGGKVDEKVKLRLDELGIDSSPLQQM